MGIFLKSLTQIANRPLYWGAMLVVPLFITLLITSMLQNSIPTQVPAAVVDMDGSSMSRELTYTLSSLQLIDMKDNYNSFSDAKNAILKGDVYGFFLIPENYQRDLLAGRAPTVSFYSNMTYYVSGTMAYKSFATTALVSKAGTVMSLAQALGLGSDQVSSMLQPVKVETRGINNPGTSYAIYLSNSLIPCAIQLMIMLTVCFALGEEIKQRTSGRLLSEAGGSVIKAVVLKLLPQTLIWWVIIMFMESWFFKWEGYPMTGSWLWITVSELMFVLACQGFALLVFGLLPDLRMSLSLCSLLSLLSFSTAALTFPEQSMYAPIRMLGAMMPIRYNFLIYSDIALNGRDLYYSRNYFIVYIIFIVLPLLILPRIKKAFISSAAYESME